MRRRVQCAPIWLPVKEDFKYKHTSSNSLSWLFFFFCKLFWLSFTTSCLFYSFSIFCSQNLKQEPCSLMFAILYHFLYPLVSKRLEKATATISTRRPSEQNFCYHFFKFLSGHHNWWNTRSVCWFSGVLVWLLECKASRNELLFNYSTVLWKYKKQILNLFFDICWLPGQAIEKPWCEAKWLKLSIEDSGRRKKKF